jgi:hypothetical protein
MSEGKQGATSIGTDDPHLTRAQAAATARRMIEVNPVRSN